MDPEENLRQIRQLAFLLTDPSDSPTALDHGALGEQLAELVIAQDEWLSKGGFLPKDWSR